MKQKLRDGWEAFKQAPLGQRFQARYENHHAKEGKWFHRAISVLIGVLMLMAGIIMLVTPGPAFIALGLGAILIAEESLMMAKLLDWIDLRGHALWRWMTHFWSTSSSWQKLITIGIPLLLIIGLIGFGFWLLFESV